MREQTIKDGGRQFRLPGGVAMSYAKAAELLDLAMEIAAQRYGMSYSGIDARSDAPSPEAPKSVSYLVLVLTPGKGDVGTMSIREYR